MRILHVYKDYAPVVGGIENHIAMLARGQAAAGHDVTVLVTAPDRVVAGAGGTAGPRPGENAADGAVEEGVRVLRAPRLATVASTPLSISLAQRLRAQRPDVTHLHVPYPVAELAWLTVGRRPLVITYHSDVVRQRWLGALWAPGLRRCLRRAARVLATSPHYVESSSFLRRVRSRVTVVPLGIDPAPFGTADRTVGRANYGDVPTLVFVGRLRYYKGVAVLLRALARLPGVQLLVVGSGPEEAGLVATATAVGVADRAHFLGNVPGADLPTVLAAGDVFVLPSVARSEAFGTVLLEAMAVGLPLVTTELGTGTSWVNQDGITGLVVPPDEPRALAAAIQALLADPEMRRRMGEAGRQRLLAEFTLDHLLRRVQTIYKEVTA